MPTKQNRAFDAAIGKLNDLCSKLIVERRRAMELRLSGEAPVANDILESLLAKDEQGHSRLSERQVLDNMRTLLFAGHDTTASALTWALFLLAKHPEWQTRVRNEVAAAGFKATLSANHEGGRPRSDSGCGTEALPTDLTFRGLEEFQVLSAVVQETLRLYPSAGFTRETDTPVTVRTSAGKEVTLPPGTEIFFFPNVVQEDPVLFDDAATFRPDRWLEPSSSEKACYFPFSLGTRSCVGERLALAEIRVSLAMLISDF